MLCAIKALIVAVITLLLSWTSSSSISTEIRLQQKQQPDSNSYQGIELYTDIKTIESYINASIYPVGPSIANDDLTFIKCYASAIKQEFQPIDDLAVEARCNAAVRWFQAHDLLNQCISQHTKLPTRTRLSCTDSILRLEDSNKYFAEMHRRLCKKHDWQDKCASYFGIIYRNILNRLDPHTNATLEYFTSTKHDRDYDDYYRYKKRYTMDQNLWKELIFGAFNTSRRSDTADMPPVNLDRNLYEKVARRLVAKISDESDSYWSYSSYHESRITQSNFVRFYRHYITESCRRYMKETSPAIEFAYISAKPSGTYLMTISFDSSSESLALFRREFCWHFTRRGKDIETLIAYLRLHGRNEAINATSLLSDEGAPLVRFDWINFHQL